MKNHSQKLQEKLKQLERQLKEKEKLLEQYKKVLKSSNERIKTISEELQFGLSLIRQIHKNFIPVDLPDIPHFQFSYRVQTTKEGISGDFFDIIPLKDPMKFGVLLSSCSNYSLAALFLSSILKFSSLLKKQQTAKGFLQKLSDQIFLSLPKKEKIHIFYGIVNRRNFTLDYSSAGNIFAALRPQNDSHFTLPVNTPTLSKENNTSFTSQTLTLNPGDTLLICSPGISERVNKKGNPFGKTSLAHILETNRKKDILHLRQKILFQAEEFSEGIPSQKDQTVLALEVKDRILKLA